jgi:hypothetical protein
MNVENMHGAKVKIEHGLYFLTGLHFPSHFLDTGARAGHYIKLIIGLTNKVRFPAGAETILFACAPTLTLKNNIPCSMGLWCHFLCDKVAGT